MNSRVVGAVVSGLAAGALAVTAAAAAQAAPPVPTADPPGPPCVPVHPELPVGGPGMVVDATTRPAPITDLG